MDTIIVDGYLCFTIMFCDIKGDTSDLFKDPVQHTMELSFENN